MRLNVTDDMPSQTDRSQRASTQGDAAAWPRRVVASICGLVVALMVGASYAAVPFYNWFCRATGFNGTTQVATSAAAAPLARQVAVRFDANVAGGLPWKFEPEQTEIKVRIGEVVTVYYTVTNQSARDHHRAGRLQCGAADGRRRISRRSIASASPSRPWRPAKSARWRWCSTSIRRWPRTARTTALNTITLSYTFYPVRDPRRSRWRRAEPDKRKGNL